MSDDYDFQNNKQKSLAELTDIAGPQRALVIAAVLPQIARELYIHPAIVIGMLDAKYEPKHDLTEAARWLLHREGYAAFASYDSEFGEFLLRLAFKCDRNNLRKLAAGFPEVALMVHLFHIIGLEPIESIAVYGL